MNRLAAALSVSALFGLTAFAQPPVQPTKESPKEVTKVAKPVESTEVKSFSVEHFTPTELSQALSQVWGKLPRKAGEPLKPMPKLAVNDRTKTLIVIGSKAELETLTNILTAIDADPAKSSPEGAPVFLLRLKHAGVQEAVAALSSLELGDHVLAMGQNKTLIVVPVSATCGTQVRQVIEHLDKESIKTTPKKPTN